MPSYLPSKDGSGNMLKNVSSNLPSKCSTDAPWECYEIYNSEFTCTTETWSTPVFVGSECHNPGSITTNTWVNLPFVSECLWTYYKSTGVHCGDIVPCADGPTVDPPAGPAFFPSLCDPCGPCAGCCQTITVVYGALDYSVNPAGDIDPRFIETAVLNYVNCCLWLGDITDINGNLVGGSGDARLEFCLNPSPITRMFFADGFVSCAVVSCPDTNIANFIQVGTPGACAGLGGTGLPLQRLISITVSNCA